MPALELNHESVSAELIDDEVVIVHFGTGNYYSLRGPAVTLWNALTSGVPVEQIHESLPNETAQQRVTEFVNHLTAEELLRERAPELVPASAVGDFQWDGLTAADPALDQLQVERFGDMQMLLLSDPIHEVDESGWPTLTEE